MPADIVLASELKSLQEEAAARRERRPTALPAVDRALGNATPAADGVAAAASAPEATGDAQALHDQLGELVDQVTQFFDDAQKNIAAHPAESVIAAFVIGILIGRLLGRG